MVDPLALAAAGWGISTAGWIISPIVAKLVNYGASSGLISFNVSEKLRKLETRILPRLVIALEALERSGRHELVKKLVRELKAAFYEVDDILDEADYCRLEKQVALRNKKRKRTTTSDHDAGPSNLQVGFLYQFPSANFSYKHDITSILEYNIFCMDGTHSSTRNLESDPDLI